MNWKDGLKNKMRSQIPSTHRMEGEVKISDQNRIKRNYCTWERLKRI